MREDLFDAEFFSKLNTLKFALKVNIMQGMSGARKSTAKGSSVEFSDFREYIPGDDIRRIDWNAYGRTDRLYIKQFMEEKEAVFNVFVDTSRSMEFGEPKKLDTALKTAAAFAYVVLGNLDRVCISGVSSGGVSAGKSVTGRQAFAGILEELSGMSADGTTSLAQSVRRRGVMRGGVSVVISDFLDKNGLEEALGYLAYMKQRIVMIQVSAREETDIDLEGTVNILDMEDGDRVRITMSNAAVRAYMAAREAHEKELYRLAGKYGASYVRLRTDEPLEAAVLRYFGGIFAGR